jgi:hypothetical protein
MNLVDLNEAPPLTDDEEQEVTQLYEERADHLDLQSFRSNTALTSDSEDYLGRVD